MQGRRRVIHVALLSAVVAAAVTAVPASGAGWSAPHRLVRSTSRLSVRGCDVAKLSDGTTLAAWLSEPTGRVASKARFEIISGYVAAQRPGQTGWGRAVRVFRRRAVGSLGAGVPGSFGWRPECPKFVARGGGAVDLVWGDRREKLSPRRTQKFLFSRLRSRTRLGNGHWGRIRSPFGKRFIWDADRVETTPSGQALVVLEIGNENGEWYATRSPAGKWTAPRLLIPRHGNSGDTLLQWTIGPDGSGLAVDPKHPGGTVVYDIGQDGAHGAAVALPAPPSDCDETPLLARSQQRTFAAIGCGVASGSAARVVVSVRDGRGSFSPWAELDRSDTTAFGASSDSESAAYYAQPLGVTLDAAGDATLVWTRMRSKGSDRNGLPSYDTELREATLPAAAAAWSSPRSVVPRFVSDDPFSGALTADPDGGAVVTLSIESAREECPPRRGRGPCTRHPGRLGLLTGSAAGGWTSWGTLAVEDPLIAVSRNTAAGLWTTDRGVFTAGGPLSP